MSAADRNAPARVETSKYSKVSRRIWNDRRFREISKPRACGGWLFFRLLTAPEATAVPGIYQAWEGALAESIGWNIREFRKAFEELSTRSMAKADWSCGLVWLPNAIRHNEPASPNVVVSWRSQVRELPECELLDEAIAELVEHLREMGDEWIAAWEMASVRVHRPAKIPRSVCEAVRERDGDACRYCGKRVNWSDRRGPGGATYDHTDPAGPSTAENLVVACRSCNSKKGISRGPKSQPRSDLGSDLGSEPEDTRVTQVNQEQEKEQDQDQEQEKEQESRDPPRIFAMHPGWQPHADTWASFDASMIPRWASEALVGKHRSHFSAAKTDIRTDEAWNQSCSKWVHGDWNNPAKRPKKPEPEAGSGGGMQLPKGVRIGAEGM